MTRLPPLLPAIGLACLIALAIAALFGTAGVAYSYLAAWLVLLALPAGALPLLAALELFGHEAGAATPVLRGFAGLMPFAAVAALPVLLSAGWLYPGLGQGEGFAQAWMGTGAFTLRAILMLAAWAGLGFVFSRPPARPRPLAAGLGLALHLVIGTLAAGDWVLALEPGFASSGFGLLFMTAQAGFALAAGLLVSAFRAGTPPRPLRLALLVGLGAWVFLAFTHFLVVWSANLPAEVAWYLHRAAGLGREAEVAAALVALAAAAILSFEGAARRPGVAAAVAALLVLLHGVEMLWLVTPALRGHFSLTLADLLAVTGLVGLGLGGSAVLPWIAATRRLGHG